VAGYIPEIPCQWLQCSQVCQLSLRNFRPDDASVYFFWSYHSAAKGVFDFETAGKNLQRLFDYAREAGIWIIARPGPYCNAETNAGGFALWGSDGSMGSLRTSDATYHNAWLPWITNIGEILAANEITKGGVGSGLPIIFSKT
jgi:beta-galactosidase GanA